MTLKRKTCKGEQQSCRLYMQIAVYLMISLWGEAQKMQPAKPIISVVELRCTELFWAKCACVVGTPMVTATVVVIFSSSDSSAP
jgi:hypothetical protein